MFYTSSDFSLIIKEKNGRVFPWEICARLPVHPKTRVLNIQTRVRPPGPAARRGHPTPGHLHINLLYILRILAEMSNGRSLISTTEPLHTTRHRGPCDDQVKMKSRFIRSKSIFSTDLELDNDYTMLIIMNWLDFVMDPTKVVNSVVTPTLDPLT